MTGASGKVILYDKDGYKLDESITKQITPGGSETISFDFIWPAGDEVKVELQVGLCYRVTSNRQNFCFINFCYRTIKRVHYPMVGYLRRFCHRIFGHTDNKNPQQR